MEKDLSQKVMPYTSQTGSFQKPACWLQNVQDLEDLRCCARTSEGFEKHPDHVARVAADLEIMMATVVVKITRGLNIHA